MGESSMLFPVLYVIAHLYMGSYCYIFTLFLFLSFGIYSSTMNAAFPSPASMIFGACRYATVVNVASRNRNAFFPFRHQLTRAAIPFPR